MSCPVGLTRADRVGWRRVARSFGAWQEIVSLPSCTQGEIWDALQKRCFLQPGPDDEAGTEWEYAITLKGETPRDMPARQQPTQSQTYRDRMMRAGGH